jgi:AcrR family transcriptional regulator
MVKAPKAAAEPRASAKDKILNAAERLFARAGVDGVSMREILKEAGVNVASIHYHFGSKDDLLLALAARQFPRVVERQLELLRACAPDSTRPPLVEQIVEAFVRPALEWRGAADSTYGQRMIAALSFQGGELQRRIYVEHFHTADAKFIEALRAALPEASPEAIYWRYASMISAVMYTLAGIGRIQYLSRGLYDPTDVERSIGETVRFYSGALSAAAQAATSSGARKPAASSATSSAIARSTSAGS